MQGNCGSAAMCDIACLQALSHRIHLGKFIAESIYQTAPERFVQLIKQGDSRGISTALTDPGVDEGIFERLRLKANAYGIDPAFPTEDGKKLDINAVLTLYQVREIGEISQRI